MENSSMCVEYGCMCVCVCVWKVIAGKLKMKKTWMVSAYFTLIFSVYLTRVNLDVHANSHEKSYQLKGKDTSIRLIAWCLFINIDKL